jgi:hypothetical protein
LQLQIVSFLFTGAFDLPADASLNDYCEVLDTVAMLRM